MQSIWRHTAIYARKERLPRAYSIDDTTVYLFTDAQTVEFMHSTIPSVTCLRLSDASVICRVNYFQFPIQSDVAESLGKSLSGTQRTYQGKDFIVIRTLKMETIIP